MIFNSNEIYATVWKATLADNKKYMDLQVTTSEKDQDGSWKNSSWFPRVIGHALQTLKDVKRGDRITITKSKFTNEAYEDANGDKKSYFRFVILEATISQASNGDNAPSNTTNKSAKPKKEAPAPTTTTGESEDDPW